MRKLFFMCLGLGIALFTNCNKDKLFDPSLSDNSLNQTQFTNNVNLPDPWTTSTKVQVYVKNSSLTTIPQNTEYPWYTAGNPLAVANPDIYSNEGWELAYENFGTAMDGVDFPYFALYNKRRGILRLFLYNAQRVIANYFRGELYFRENNYSNSILSFVAAEDKSTMESFDPQEKQTVLAYANAFSSWINFDFNLTNYDNRTNINNVLDFKLFAINQADISLTSTEFSIVHDMVNSSQLGTSKSSFSSTLSDGQKYVKNIDDARKALKEIKTDGDAKFFSAINSFISKPYIQAIPYLGTALGVIKSFIGGKTEPFPWQMLKFNGKLKMEGTFTATNPIYNISLATTNDIPTGTVTKKLNTTDFGVFNLTKNPTLIITSDQERYDQGGLGWPGQEYDYVRSTKFAILNGSNDLILNPSSGLTLVSKRIKIIALHNYYKPGVVDEFVTWDNNSSFESDYVILDVPADSGGPLLFPDIVGVELIFRPIGMTNDSKDIVFLKTYKPNFQD